MAKENFISPRIKEGIEEKQKKIEKFGPYLSKKKELIEEDLKNMGDVYSFWIEHPDLRKDLLLENRKEDTIKKLSREGIENVKNGWYYLISNWNDGEFTQNFDENAIKKVNKLVNGDRGNYHDFRQRKYIENIDSGRVTLNIKEYNPPSPEDVPEKISGLLERVREFENENKPLESAITAHLGMAAIQPFYEGNKRTARLFQDRILRDSDFPPAVIETGEAGFYLNLLSKTLPSYKNSNVEGQRQFYDYCASKVNNSLDYVLDDLGKGLSKSISQNTPIPTNFK